MKMLALCIAMRPTIAKSLKLLLQRALTLWFDEHRSKGPAMRRSIRHLVLASVALLAVTPAFAGKHRKPHVVASGAAGISIPMDEARVIAFNRPVQTVFVGNPMVADVNMIDSRHAFIMGKAFGVTNLIALDSNGNPIASRHVTVLGGSTLVTLNRGAEQYTYACATARCEHARVPGDPKTPYDDNMSEIQAREEFAQKQADASAGPRQ
jgi:hypothetical protein